jgi:type IV pilus assembly protein PilA
VTKLHTRRGGFTLIELMIVVAIIGILAAIAIPNFLRFQLKAKSSEGKTNLAAIRTSEESYFAEYGGYVSALPSPPALPIPNVKTAFSNGSGPGAGFDRVGWAPEGEVYFSYSVNAPATVDSFLAASHADIDNDANPQYWGYAKDDPSGGSMDGKSHGGLGTCLRASLTEETVMPCTADSGNSVF